MRRHERPPGLALVRPNRPDVQRPSPRGELPASNYRCFGMHGFILSSYTKKVHPSVNRSRHQRLRDYDVALRLHYTGGVLLLMKGAL